MSRRPGRTAPAALAALAALAVSALLAPAAGADGPTGTVRIEQQRIVVSTPAGRAVIERSPFRLRIRDASGRERLATVGRATTSGGTTYAGLGFTVGYEPELRYPVFAGDPDPNPPASTPPGRRLAVTAVRSAARRGAGVRLTLATDDPGARTVALSVGPGARGTLAVEARVSGKGVTAVAAAFRSRGREAFHGFGGRRESTNLRGTSFQNWVRDYRFPSARGSYYAPLPMFLSSRGYGLLLDQPELARWRLASDRRDAWRIAAAGPHLRLVVAPARPARAISKLTAISGRHLPAPLWSLGPTLSRAVRVAADTPHRYAARITHDLARIRRYRLPLSAYAFEGWETLDPSFVRRVVRTLKARGIHAILYMRSFVSADAAGTEKAGRFDEVLRRGYGARTSTGAPYRFGSPFLTGDAVLVDFTNPAARAWWTRRVRDLLDTGADGFMSDFGEQVLPDMVFANGETGPSLHNRYPALQAQVTREAVERYRRAHPRRQVYFFQRAGYTGRPGSLAFEDAAFPGDETADWDRETGLPSIVPDMLNRAVAGASGFTTDIGGYFDVFRDGPPINAPGVYVGPTIEFRPASRELFLRWSQAAVFTPFFRVHNSAFSEDGVRMPWSFGTPTRRLWTALARLHIRAEPLIRRLWREAARTGAPLTRPLWLDDPAAARSPRSDDEWLLGRDLLVAPVLRDRARSRSVRLPAGCWRREGRGRHIRGARTLTVPASLSQLPWFSRCGKRPLG